MFIFTAYSAEICGVYSADFQCYKELSTLLISKIDCHSQLYFIIIYNFGLNFNSVVDPIFDNVYWLNFYKKEIACKIKSLLFII